MLNICNSSSDPDISIRLSPVESSLIPGTPANPQAVINIIYDEDYPKRALIHHPSIPVLLFHPTPTFDTPGFISAYLCSIPIFRSLFSRKPQTTAMPFQYKKVLVIGATSGIGKALASRIVQEGSSVVVVGRRKENLEAFVHQHGKDKASAVPFDTTELEKIPNFVTKLVSGYM